MEEPLHGQRIGAYRIIRQLGAGGMGEVYEAEHVALGVRRALKVFSTESEHVEFLRKRFIDEGRILAAFQHPRIVRVYNLVVDEESDKAYFEMDLVLSPTGQPRTLADEQRDGVSEDKIVGWFKDICEGLAYIHSQGVVHRDISLDNILIGPDGRAVITDFGIAKIIDDSFRKRIDMTVTVVSKDGSELRMGKGLYMAPELNKGGKATFASDAYAVGVILFRLLTGAWYAPGTNLDLLPNFKYDWRPVISRLCNVDPEKRLGEGGIAALPSLLNRVDLEMEESSPLQADHVLQPGIADSADHAANHVPFWRWKWIALGGALLAIIVVICGVRLFMEGVHEKAVDVQHDNFSGRDNVDMEKCIVTLNGVELRADLTIDKNTGSKFVKVVSVRNANGDFAIPEKVYGCTVTSIGDSAFRNSYGLTSLEIPIGVKSIGGEAFLGCTNLTSATIPHSVESIGNDAFRNCCMLAKIAIPNSVKELGFGVLGFCYNLTEI